MVTVCEVPTWVHRAILLILYLNRGEISKQKLYGLLYLIYKESKDIDSLEDLNFYLNMKTKEIKITTSDKEIGIDDILYNLSLDGFINDCNDKIYLTDRGYKAAKAIINDPEYKNEVDIIIRVIAQYKDLSEQGLINLILENLKRS